jgi:hypothetical protein
MRRDDTGIKTESDRRPAGPKPDDMRRMKRLEASIALMLSALFADKENTIVDRRKDARVKLARSFDPTN